MPWTSPVRAGRRAAQPQHELAPDAGAGRDVVEAIGPERYELDRRAAVRKRAAPAIAVGFHDHDPVRSCKLAESEVRNKDCRRRVDTISVSSPSMQSHLLSPAARISGRRGSARAAGTSGSRSRRGIPHQVEESRQLRMTAAISCSASLLGASRCSAPATALRAASDRVHACHRCGHDGLPEKCGNELPTPTATIDASAVIVARWL